MKNSLSYSMIVAFTLSACGGHEAADPDKITAVLVDDRGKASPDATIQVLHSDGVEVLQSNNMDSDGRFSLFPPGAGNYNVMGVFGDTKKVIKQNVTMNEELTGINLGKLQASSVGILSLQVKADEGVNTEGLVIQVIGTDLSSKTKIEGVGLIPGVPAGTYTVKVSGDGIEDKILDKVTIQSGETTLIENLTLD